MSVAPDDRGRRTRRLAFTLLAALAGSLAGWAALAGEVQEDSGQDRSTCALD